MFYTDRCRAVPTCVCECMANSKQYKSNVAAGCLYSIVASFIGLCGSASMCLCIRLHNSRRFVIFFSFFTFVVLGCSAHTQQIISNVVGKNSYLALEHNRTNKKNVKHSYTLARVRTFTHIAVARHTTGSVGSLNVPFNRTKFFQFSSALSVVALS